MIDLVSADGSSGTLSLRFPCLSLDTVRSNIAARWNTYCQILAPLDGLRKLMIIFQYNGIFTDLMISILEL